MHEPEVEFPEEKKQLNFLSRVGVFLKSFLPYNILPCSLLNSPDI
jgi:hypothetical protein